MRRPAGPAEPGAGPAELLPCRSGGPALPGRAPADSRMLFLHMQKKRAENQHRRQCALGKKPHDRDGKNSFFCNYVIFAASGRRARRAENAASPGSFYAPGPGVGGCGTARRSAAGRPFFVVGNKDTMKVKADNNNRAKIEHFQARMCLFLPLAVG